MSFAITLRRAPVLTWIAAILVSLYALGNVALYAWQRDLIYQPFGRSAAPAAVGVPEMAVVSVRTEDGVTLRGWHAPPSVPGAPTVVIFHGNIGTLAMRAFKARAFLDAGYGVWLAGYRGFDGNPGWPSETGLYADARAALDYLARRGTPPRQVVVYGESLGTGVAVQMATERPVAGVILEAPYTSIPDVAALRFPLMPVHWLATDRFDSLAKIGLVKAPLMIMHGDSDTVIPMAMGERLYQAATGRKQAVIIAGANHVDLYDWGAAAAAIDFIRRWVEVRPTKSPAEAWL